MSRIINIGLVVMGLTLSDGTFVLADRPSADRPAMVQGDAERGRAVFNGKGVCHYCHGVDGYRNRQPQLEADTAALIARLNPPPTDLRNPKVQHLKTDKQRAQAIRLRLEGSSGKR